MADRPAADDEPFGPIRLKARRPKPDTTGQSSRKSDRAFASFRSNLKSAGNSPHTPPSPFRSSSRRRSLTHERGVYHRTGHRPDPEASLSLEGFVPFRPRGGRSMYETVAVSPQPPEHVALDGTRVKAHPAAPVAQKSGLGTGDWRHQGRQGQQDFMTVLTSCAVRGSLIFTTRNSADCTVERFTIALSTTTHVRGRVFPAPQRLACYRAQEKRGCPQSGQSYRKNDSKGPATRPPISFPSTSLGGQLL
jgi:hypothetical protein